MRQRRGVRVWVRGVLVALAMSSTAGADVAAARAALERGDYAQVEPALTGLRANERAAGDALRGRWMLETGRDADARALGERMGRVAATRAQGLTLEGEALVAVGRYDDAVTRWQRAFATGDGPATWRARALAATWLQRLGRRDEAREAANGLIDAYNDAADHEGSGGAARASVLHDAEFLTYVGVAARALGAVRNANQAFNEALAIAPGRVETNLEQAELMLSTEDMGPAGEAIRAALHTNPHSARGLALRARTRLASDLDLPHAQDDLRDALAVNPRLTTAMALQASVALRDRGIAEATRLLDQAAAINPRDLDVLTERGVTRFIADDTAGFRTAFDALFQVSPTRAEAYEALADASDWEHRYAEAVDLMREGLARPGLASERRLTARIRAALGMNLLRMGREDDGLAELRTSFEGSRFNVRVANLLNFYEHTIPDQYVTETAGGFVMRYQKDERAVMRRYAPPMLQRAWDDMVRRYGFTPEGPIRVEMYADSEHFSVRTAGLPEIGVQGVCFGRVVTALSPRGGEFNWAQILWHELAHVFAIQRSRSRVPRWFTEGLSEWEAFHSHPRWAREDDPSLYRALQSGTLPHVAEFNTAFTHARHPEDMMVAYYAASKLVEFMIDRYGFERVASMLPRWGEGLDTPEVIQRALGVSAEALDTQFREAARQRLQRYATQFTVDPAEYRDRAAREQAATAHPGDADALSAAAVAALLAGDAQAAAQRAEAAVRIDGGNARARWCRAMLAIQARDGRAALTELDALFHAGKDGYELRWMEARAAVLTRDDARIVRALDAAVAKDPSQAEAWRALATVHGRMHHDDDRVRALQQTVQLDQHDREALGELLTALRARRDWTAIRALVDHATELDPESLDVQLTLAMALTELGDRDAAITRYETALDLSPPDPAALRTRIAAVRAGRRDLPFLGGDSPGDAGVAQGSARSQRQTAPSSAPR